MAITSRLDSWRVLYSTWLHPSEWMSLVVSTTWLLLFNAISKPLEGSYWPLLIMHESFAKSLLLGCQYAKTLGKSSPPFALTNSSPSYELTTQRSSCSHVLSARQLLNWDGSPPEMRKIESQHHIRAFAIIIIYRRERWTLSPSIRLPSVSPLSRPNQSKL